MKPRQILSIAVFVLAAVLPIRAEVALPRVLADHMVIQRGQPVHVWGKAAPGEAVSVTFRGETRSTTADNIGRWGVYFLPVEAGGPFDMTVKGSNIITLRDILVGDVWIASGQSNMEFGTKEVDNSAAELAAANYPRIRLFHVANKSSDYPLDDVDAKPWTVCTPETVRDFSAVAYFFGRELHQKTGVPVGLIASSWGGTPVDAWTSLHAISQDASLMPVFAEWSKMNDGAAAHRIRRAMQLKAWQAAVEKAKVDKTTPPPYPWERNEGNSWMPAGLYNAMIAPLTPFPIRGAIWYQGESNATPERAPLYNHLFSTMIQDWRSAWGVGDFPFLFVQLANFRTGPNSWWPALREAQLKTLSLANTGMAVTIDIGNPTDIHPKNKQDVGKRLALAARALSYGEKIEYSGPIFRNAIPEGEKIRVFFDHTGSGLMAKSGALRGFYIAGPERRFVPGQAVIEGPSVVVSSEWIKQPLYVRYAWSDDPDCNLYNVEGLPASPFRSAE